MSGDLERIITTAVVISGPWVVGCRIWPLRGGRSDRGRRVPSWSACVAARSGREAVGV